MTPEEAAALRAPFPPEEIGSLPKPMSRDAVKGRCDVCGGWHGLPAVHLPYVGHATATDRLLQVDPEWSWEPFALTEAGLPALDREGNLWIRLTISGVTRPGVGDGANMKERISDAIRNAAMRFGVALDLWKKSDQHETTTRSENRTEPPPTTGRTPEEAKARELLAELPEERLQLVRKAFKEHFKATLAQLSPDRHGDALVFVEDAIADLDATGEPS